MATDWRDEVDKMLVEFERQAKLSLANIRMAFKRSGLSFNPKFRQYFLQVSNTRLENTYDHFEIRCRLEEEMFSQASSSSSVASSGTGAVIGSTHVKSESESQNATLIEIDDSSDDEAAEERERKSNASVRGATAPIVFSAHDLGAKIQGKGGRLERIKESTSSMKGVGDVNGFRIGSTVIRGRQSTARTATSDRVALQNAVNTPNGHSNDGVENQFGMRNPIIFGRQNGKSGVEDVSMMVADASKNNRKKSKVLSVDNGAQMNKKTTIGNSSRLVLKQSKGKKRFQCTVCDYSTNHKSHFDTHIRTHTGERPYRCDRCGKGFTTDQILKRHAMTHTDVYPFHCKGCFSQFSLKTEKEAHDKGCTARRYECHLCHKFVTCGKALLKTHMRKHTGEKLFRCQICMKRFGCKKGIKYHLDNVHTRINP